MELGIGTVQFGLDYGISNEGGRCSAEEVGRILDCAERRRIRLLDTAAAYGNSEQVLGEHLSRERNFRVVTKLGPVGSDLQSQGMKSRFDELYRGSRARLGEVPLYGLLLHHFEDLVGAQADVLWGAMQEVKARGEVEKIGVSIYSGDQIDYVLKRHEIDLIQLPLSILDQRLIESGHLQRLRESNIEIHARSVFLQGLLLMDPRKVPAYFEPIRPNLLAFRKAAAERGYSPLSAALAYVRGTAAVDSVVVGINFTAELIEIAEAWASAPDLDFESKCFAVSDPRFVNPANWPASERSSES